jgi:hypothetical protein
MREREGERRGGDGREEKGMAEEGRGGNATTTALVDKGSDRKSETGGREDKHVSPFPLHRWPGHHQLQAPSPLDFSTM